MNRIKELRKQCGLSQKAFADIVGVNVRTIQKWESGETAIKAVKTASLADYFEVSEGYLLGYSQNPGIPESEARELQLPKYQQHILKIQNIETSLMRDTGQLSEYELDSIKKHTRSLYELVVRKQFEAEEREGK